MSSFEQPTGNSRVPVSPEMGRRVAILGFVALALFAIVFFRLWFLQVLSGNNYVQQARENRVRLVSVLAPRGLITDRNGEVLVENTPGTSVQIEPSRLPAAERAAAAKWGQDVNKRAAKPKAQRGAPVKIPALGAIAPSLVPQFAALGQVLHMSASEIQRTVVEQLTQVPYAPVRLKLGVAPAVRNYLVEHSSRFPTVSVQRVYIRTYPQRQLAAQLMGTVGQINPTQLKEKPFRGVSRDSQIGQSGLEYSYDQYLRGVNGATRIVVDAQGRPKSTQVQTQPTPGRSVAVSLDLGLQRAGQAALSQYLAPTAYAGAFVALDPRNGQVLAMGSAPSFDPNVLARPITTKRYEQLFPRGKDAPTPLVNRAISGLYPTGSIFKPISALAGLGSGVITPTSPVQDNGCIHLGADHLRLCNAGDAANGTVDLTSALRVSSDVYFYTLGAEANRKPHQVIQTEAHKLGLGQPTGIDLGGEAAGTLPDAAWRRRLTAQEHACEKREHKASCGISDGREWSIGDNAELAVGQGDLQATPLQMAVAYAAIENDGTVVTPHLGMSVEDQAGQLLQTLRKGPARKVAMDPTGRAAIMAGLHGAVAEPGGTATSVFNGWPQGALPVYGKTGTAVRTSRPADQSWFAAFVPDAAGHRPIVVVATVEDGDFGAQAAAPVACQILRHWYKTEASKASCDPGSSQTR